MYRMIQAFIVTNLCLFFWACPSIALVTEYKEAFDTHHGKNYKTSYKLIIPLEKIGVAEAQYNLEGMYEKEKEVNKSFKKAKKWVHFSADQGLAKAQENLSFISTRKRKFKSENSSNDVSKNTINFNHKNLKDGVRALNNKNFKIAHNLFLELAEQGVVEAQYNLGLMYAKGRGVAKNYKKALTWWGLAANQGHGKAQTNLAWMYEMGKGTPKNVHKAIKWYQLASKQGVAKAQKKINLLLHNTQKKLQEPSPSSMKFKNAKEIKEKQTTTTDLLNKKSEAQIYLGLGIRFENGQGVPQDYHEAIRWYRLAVELGQVKAQEKLNLLLNKMKKHLQNPSTSSKEFKSVKEINNKQSTTASLQSEPNQVELDNTNKPKAGQEQFTSISKNLSTLNAENFPSGVDLFDLPGYSADLFIKLSDYRDVKPNSFEFEFSKLKNIDRSLEFYEQLYETMEKDKIKQQFIHKKDSTIYLTKKLKKDSNRNNSEISSSKDFIPKYLDNWVRSWETKDIELYISFYSKIFKGLEETRNDWRTSRQAAFKRHKNISIQIENIKFFSNTDNVEIIFTQTFKSDGYSDVGVKDLIWVKNGGDWRITKETWVGQ